ncbi:MAG: SRPBCC domain-containing protein [Propionibacteriaceae bacterium]|jgi:uncharacterized protein YndB with AHSA1/START domain|nr:SRPBCC domain-containing protein [Propionibacteriaceae bacterium]
MTVPASSDTLGQSSDTAVVQVSRSVSKPVKEVWKLLVTREGAEALLGPGGELGDKGDGWRANDGTFGVIRSYHPLEEIRFSWHVADDAPKTMVEVKLVKASEAETTVEVTHDRIPSYYDTAKLTRRWESALDKLSSAAD